MDNGGPMWNLLFCHEIPCSRGAFQPFFNWCFRAVMSISRLLNIFLKVSFAFFFSSKKVYLMISKVKSFVDVMFLLATSFWLRRKPQSSSLYSAAGYSRRAALAAPGGGAPRPRLLSGSGIALIKRIPTWNFCLKFRHFSRFVV